VAKRWRTNPTNQFDVVYKIINDFNYRGNGSFIVSGARERLQSLVFQRSEEGPRFRESVHLPGIYLHATLGDGTASGNASLIFSGCPQSHELYISLITNRKTFDSPWATLFNYWVTSN